MTVLLYVRRKGWPLQSIEVESTHKRVIGRDSEREEAGGQGYSEVVRQRILLKGDLSEEQRDRISEIAARCPVYRILKASPVLEEEVFLVE